MDEHELAWAAGFFDGDGWAARVKHRRSTRPMAQISQASVNGVPEVLVRFRDAVGVGRVRGPRIEEGRQPLYSWIASSRGDVARTGSSIGPWLSEQKRRQFRAAADLRFETKPIDIFAWAAGLFDAEGSTSLSDHRSHAGYKAIEAAITQGSPHGVPQELLRFMNLMDAGRVNGLYVQEGATEPVYRWRMHRADEIQRMIHVLLPWLGTVKRRQAMDALIVIDRQPVLDRGRVEWGSHKTHCIHGHEYAMARIRPYRSRGGVERRASKQCLASHASRRAHDACWRNERPTAAGRRSWRSVTDYLLK